MGKKNILVQEIQIDKKFSSGFSTHVDWEPRTNIIECGIAVIIEVELPGVYRKDISILLESERELVIKGTKPKPIVTEPNVTYYLFEREFGQFFKHILIDFPLDTENIESVMKNGVLTIRIPKKPRRRVSVNVK